MDMTDHCDNSHIKRHELYYRYHTILRFIPDIPSQYWSKQQTNNELSCLLSLTLCKTSDQSGQALMIIVSWCVMDKLVKK